MVTKPFTGQTANIKFSIRKISLWQNRGKLPLQGLHMRTATLMESRTLCRVWQMQAIWHPILFFIVYYSSFWLSEGKFDYRVHTELLHQCSVLVQKPAATELKRKFGHICVNVAGPLCPGSKIMRWFCTPSAFFGKFYIYIYIYFLSSRHSRFAKLNQSRAPLSSTLSQGVESCPWQDCCQVFFFFNGLRLSPDYVLYRWHLKY